MTEAELCAAFAAAAWLDGWTVYPEVSGWDLVLVWAGGVPPPGCAAVRQGDQVGVEAKLRASVDVLSQVIGRLRWRGRPATSIPDFAAVLAPHAGSSFVHVAEELGLGVYTLRHCGPWQLKRRGYGYDRPRKTVSAGAHRLTPKQRLWLPPVVPRNVVAGLPSPSGLTPWRVKALRICVRLQSRGYVTLADFRELGIDSRRWVDRGRWLVPDGNVPGSRVRRFVAAPGARLPDARFGAERDAIAALQLDEV